MADKPLGFVALEVDQAGAAGPGRRRSPRFGEIYFKTTKRTIEHDIAHAIELLKIACRARTNATRPRSTWKGSHRCGWSGHRAGKKKTKRT